MENTLNMSAERSPVFRKPVGVLKKLSADECNRMICEDRVKLRRDIASRMDGAIRETTETFARKLLEDNCPIDNIVKYTGLTRERIEMLKQDLS